jgi:carboxylesterase type B
LASADLQKYTETCNYGISDQKTAIDWITRNIEGFGGDPNNITVGGQSAGGASAHAQSLLQPTFKRAIVQSGAVGTLGPRTLEWHESRWSKLCSYFGVEGLDPEERIARLRQVPSSKIVKAAADLSFHTFPLVVDDVIKPEYSFDGSTISELMTGDVTRESMGTFEPRIRQLSNNNILEAFAELPERGAIFDEYGIDFDDRGKLEAGLADFLTDVAFALPIAKLCDTWPADRPLYRYRCTRGNPFIGSHTYGHAHHCVDLIYIFNCFQKEMKRASPESQKYAEDWGQIWIDFITGNRHGVLGEVKASGFIAFDEEIRVGNVNGYVWETHRRRRALIGGLDLTTVLENLGL